MNFETASLSFCASHFFETKQEITHYPSDLYTYQMEKAYPNLRPAPLPYKLLDAEWFFNFSRIFENQRPCKFAEKSLIKNFKKNSKIDSGGWNFLKCFFSSKSPFRT